MPAWMDSRHHNSFQKWESLHRESFIEVFSLDVKTNVFVADWHSILSSTEVHPWGVVVLIIDDVHLIMTVILKLLLLLFKPSALQHHNLVISFLDDLVFYLLILNLESRVEPSPADHLLKQQVLLILVEILTLELLIFRRLPLPAIANFDKMIACTFKLIRRELSSLLEHVLLWRRAPFLPNLLHSLVKQILSPVKPAAHQEQIIGDYLAELQVVIIGMIKQQDFLFKIVIVGNQGVGKSSLFIRFCDDNFADNYLPTIGVDFRFKMTDHDGKTCKLQIWDTAGQERFRTITSAYYRSSQVVLIVYDLTDPASFKEIQDYWVQEAKNNSDSDIMICIVGNKCDMPSQVLDSDISMLVQSIGLPSYLVSAKTGEGVEKMFSEICEKLIKTATIRKKEKETKLGSKEEQKKRCCK